MTEPLDELVRRARDGEVAARATLYERLAETVRRRIRYGRRARNWFWLEEIEDVVQEVFARFFEALDRGRYEHRSEDGLVGFLVKTGFFVVLDTKNQVRKAGRLLPSRAESEGFDLVSFSKSLPDSLAEKECLARLYAEVQILPEARRRVLLGWILGRSVADMASELDRTANAISGLKFQALKQLRERLVESGFLADCGELFGLEPG